MWWYKIKTVYYILQWLSTALCPLDHICFYHSRLKNTHSEFGTTTWIVCTKISTVIFRLAQTLNLWKLAMKTGQLTTHRLTVRLQNLGVLRVLMCYEVVRRIFRPPGLVHDGLVIGTDESGVQCWARIKISSGFLLLREIKQFKKEDIRELFMSCPICWDIIGYAQGGSGDQVEIHEGTAYDRVKRWKWGIWNYLFRPSG